MRRHRFFTPSKINSDSLNTFSNLDVIHQLRRVFRLHEGDKAIFFDGTGSEYESEIVSITASELTFRVLEKRLVKPFSETRLVLAVSLIKKDNFEWVVQKATELGVAEVIPLISDRSEKKGFNVERANKIMIEACEQSGRADVVTIHEPISFQDFLAEEKRSIIAFHTEGESFDVPASLEKEIVACIGPEGGWSENETALFKEHHVALEKLSSPVLRAETAAVAITTLILVR